MPRRIRLVAFIFPDELSTKYIIHLSKSYYIIPKVDNRPPNKAYTSSLKRLSFLSEKVYL